MAAATASSLSVSSLTTTHALHRLLRPPPSFPFLLLRPLSAAGKPLFSVCPKSTQLHSTSINFLNSSSSFSQSALSSRSFSECALNSAPNAPNPSIEEEIEDDFDGGIESDEEDLGSERDESESESFCESALNSAPNALNSSIEDDIEDDFDGEIESGSEGDELKLEDRDVNVGDGSVKQGVKREGLGVPKLTVKEKKELASYAHGLGKKLKSQLVGKSGVTDNVATSFIETLEANELLKIKIHRTCPGELEDVVQRLEESTGSVVVSKIGRTVIIYRPSISKMKAEQKKNQERRVYVRKDSKFNPGSQRGRVQRLTGRGRQVSSRI